VQKLAKKPSRWTVLWAKALLAVKNSSQTNGLQ
jgi:hypothetical protein